MEGRILKNSQIIVLGLCIAAATILSSTILSRAFITIKKYSNEVIGVTGSAEKKIVSDYCTWRTYFTRRAPELTVAFENLRKDLKRVKQYLRAKGVKSEEIAVSPVDTETLYKKNKRGRDTNEIEGYRLGQSVWVKSYDVEKVTEASREVTELISEGIEISSDPPQYLYTKLAELKLEMLALAAEDARNRAEKMVAATGNKISLMRSAQMGVFQITPANSYEVSSYGVNDTSSWEKKVTAVVHVDFGVKD